MDLTYRVVHEVDMPNEAFDDVETLINVEHFLRRKAKVKPFHDIEYRATFARGGDREINPHIRRNMCGVVRFYARITVADQ